MNNVFVITEYYDYETSNVLAVTTTLKKAKECIKEYISMSGDSYDRRTNTYYRSEHSHNIRVEEFDLYE